MTWGFGESSSVGAAVGSAWFGWGFGDPVPATIDPLGLDWGFGDPPSPVLALSLLPATANRQYGDDGGDLITMIAAWPTTGPYRVTLRETFTLVSWPDGLGCYSAQAGKGVLAETDVNKKRLAVAMPTVPPGTYDLVVAYGPAYGTKIELLKAIKVVWRGRSREQWALRSQFPSGWKTGARDAHIEDLLGE